MTVSWERLSEIEGMAADDEMCVHHCLCVRDLMDEIAALRKRVTHWQDLHQEACAQIAAGLRREHKDDGDPKVGDW